LSTQGGAPRLRRVALPWAILSLGYLVAAPFGATEVGPWDATSLSLS
jgi:hypothetical protein